MKKIIFILVIYLFFSGPVMAFIFNPPGNPAVVSAPAALVVIGFGLIGLGGICRKMLSERNSTGSARTGKQSVSQPQTAKALLS